MIAESSMIPRTVILSILKEDFGKRKQCASFVPQSLTPELREDRVASCQDIIAMADADKKCLNKIITGDETWCFDYDPKRKRQSSEWVGETSTRPRKLKFQRSRIKIILITFSTFKTQCTKNSYQGEKTVKAELYKGIMNGHLTRIHRVRLSTFFSRNFFLFQR